MKATEISKVCISLGAVRFPITTFRHPVGCRKLLCRRWCMPVGWMYWWYSEVLFRMLNWVQTLLTKKKNPLGCNSTKTYIRKVFDYKTDAEICLPPKWVFWPCKYHSRLQKHFQWQSETHHELILMQIKEITRHDFWTVLSLYASRCYMFIPDPTKTIFKIEKVKTISLIYFSFRENRVQFLFKFSW